MNSSTKNDHPTYSISLNVKPNHIDNLNHVNNVVYLEWVNQISEKHWAILTTKALNEKYFWVALRHEIDYLGAAYLGDELTIKTHIGETKGVKSIRYVEIYRGMKLLAQAKSTWCLIDQKTEKPTRIKDDVLEVLKS